MTHDEQRAQLREIVIRKPERYCDEGCPSWNRGLSECEEGHDVQFRTPNSWTAIMRHNWGFVRPKTCRQGHSG